MARSKKARAFEHNQLGATFYQSGAIDLALEQFRYATKRAPWVATYWLNLGIVLLDKNATEEAELALSRSLKLNPNSQSAYYHQAQLYKKRGDEAAAKTAYQKAIDLGPHTYLASRARECLEGRRPRIILGADGEQ